MEQDVNFDFHKELHNIFFLYDEMFANSTSAKHSNKRVTDFAEFVGKYGYGEHLNDNFFKELEQMRKQLQGHYHPDRIFRHLLNIPVQDVDDNIRARLEKEIHEKSVTINRFYQYVDALKAKYNQNLAYSNEELAERMSQWYAEHHAQQERQRQQAYDANLNQGTITVLEKMKQDMRQYLLDNLSLEATADKVVCEHMFDVLYQYGHVSDAIKQAFVRSLLEPEFSTSEEGLARAVRNRITEQLIFVFDKDKLEREMTVIERYGIPIDRRFMFGTEIQSGGLATILEMFRHFTATGDKLGAEMLTNIAKNHKGIVQFIQKHGLEITKSDFESYDRLSGEFIKPYYKPMYNTLSNIHRLFIRLNAVGNMDNLLTNTYNLNPELTAGVLSNSSLVIKPFDISSFLENMSKAKHDDGVHHDIARALFRRLKTDDYARMMYGDFKNLPYPLDTNGFVSSIAEAVSKDSRIFEELMSADKQFMRHGGSELSKAVYENFTQDKPISYFLDNQYLRPYIRERLLSDNSESLYRANLEDLLNYKTSRLPFNYFNAPKKYKEFVKEFFAEFTPILSRMRGNDVERMLEAKGTILHDLAESTTFGNVKKMLAFLDVRNSVGRIHEHMFGGNQNHSLLSKMIFRFKSSPTDDLLKIYYDSNMSVAQRLHNLLEELKKDNKAERNLYIHGLNLGEIMAVSEVYHPSCRSVNDKLLPFLKNKYVQLSYQTTRNMADTYTNSLKHGIFYEHDIAFKNEPKRRTPR